MPNMRISVATPLRLLAGGLTEYETLAELYLLPKRRPAPLGMWKERGAGAGWKEGAGRGLLPKLLGALPPGWRLEGVAYGESRKEPGLLANCESLKPPPLANVLPE